MRLWLDDNRNPADPITKKLFSSKGDEIWVKTARGAIDLLLQGNIDHISFDHDLGTDETGYNVALWIEENAFYGKIPRMKWWIHSANPVGKANIEMAMYAAERFWDEK